MIQIVRDLADLNKLKDHENYEELFTLSHYLGSRSSNMVQYLYKAEDGSMLKVDIYSTLEGILRKSVAFETFEQANGFPMEVSVEDLISAVSFSKGQQPSYKYRDQFASKWEEIEYEYKGGGL